MKYLTKTIKHILQSELTNVNNIPIRGYYIGDRARVFRSPYIIIDPGTESIEWMTIRYTTNEVRLDIYGYVQAAIMSNMDIVESLSFLSMDLGKELKNTMMNHIQFYIFTPSEIDGREFYNPQFLVDEYGLTVAEYYNEYPGTAQNPSVRYLYDGRVSDVDYLTVKKEGTFLRASKISCFWKFATPITQIGPDTVGYEY